MRSLSTNWKVIIAVVSAITALPLFFYWWKFGSNQLASDFDTWVDFSNYWSPFLIAALTIILAFISWQSLELMKLKEKPLIVIEKRPKREGGNEFVTFRNIGSGPAIDVKLFIKVENNKMIQFNSFLQKHGITSALEEIEKRCHYHYLVSSFSLSQEESISIDWETSIEKICIVYSDIYNKKNSIIWTEKETQYHKNDQIGVDSNGNRGERIIFQNERKPNSDFQQVFTLADVGFKRQFVIA